jgi:hypothetical protein
VRKESKDKARTQDLTIEVEPIYLKIVFTLVELGPLQKWVAKPIGNKSDNTLKKSE